MSVFNNVNELINHLESNVLRDVLENEVFDVVAQTQSRMVFEHVYNKYRPVVYKRRGYSGGLGDPKNIVGSFYKKNNTIQMLIENKTRGYNSGQYIAGLIEYGDGYNGMKYDFPYKNRLDSRYTYLKERPFIRKTIEFLEKSGRHIDALERGLNRRGIKTIR